MSPRFIAVLTLLLPVRAQTLEEQARALRARMEQAPRLALEKTEFHLQSNTEIAYPSAVCMDKQGTIYVLQRGDKTNPILAVDPNGRILRSWGKGLFKIPHSIRIDPAGNVWTVDAASSRVLKFSPKGDKLMEISVGGQPATKSDFNGTTDIAFGPNGRLFIADGYGNARILEYTSDGHRVREWGTAGTGPGQFQLPHGITVDDEGILYVADRENGRVQRFDLDGRFLGEWSGLGKVFAVTCANGKLWIGTQQRNEPNGSPGWLVQLDKGTGNIIGYVESAGGQHTVNLTGSGELLAGARPDKILWFRKSAQ